MTKQARKVLAAVVELRGYYEDKTAPYWMGNCPLCPAVGVEGWRDDSCWPCPWPVLSGRYCPPDATHSRMHPTPGWRTASIKRLKRWETLIRDRTYDQRVKEGN